MPDVLSLDNDILSFTPGNPMLTAESSAPPAPPAPAAPAGRDYGTEFTKNRAAADVEIAKVQDAQTAQVAAMQEKARAQQPFIDKALAQSQQPLPARPKRETPPPVPQRQSQHEDEQWLFASALLGSLAGALTRRHQTNALAAFSGAMEGYNEGSKQKFDQNMRVWEAENKRSLEIDKQHMDEYKGILEDRKLNEEQMLTAIKLAGLKNQDQAAVEIAKQQNGELLAKYYDKRADAAEKAQEAADKLLLQEAKMKARDEALRTQKLEDEAQTWLAGPEGQARLNAIMGLREAPPSKGIPRSGPLGFRQEALKAELDRLGYDYTKYDRAAAVNKQEALIPGRVKAAGEIAGERVGATRATNLEAAARSAGPLIEMAADAAKHVPATAFPRLNKILQATAQELGDPAIVKFQFANMELGRLIARVINPSSSTITNYQAQTAAELFLTANSPEGYQASLQQAKSLIEREFKAAQEQKGHAPLSPIDLPDTTQRQLTPTPRQVLPKGAGLTDQGRETTLDVGEGTRTLQRPEERLKHTPLAPREATPPGFPPLPPGWTFESLSPADRS